MGKRLTPLSLCAFVLADIHSDDPRIPFTVGNCRVYRFSPERLEILVSSEFPVSLRDLKVTINRGSNLVLNVPAVVTRKVDFGDYHLIEVVLAPNPALTAHLSLQRIKAELAFGKVTYIDTELLFEALLGREFDIPYVNGFSYSCGKFEVSVQDSTLRTTILNVPSFKDYQMYLMVTRICSQRIRDEFGYFDREIVVNNLDGSFFGPLNILIAYETYLWSLEFGVRNSCMEVAGEKLTYNPKSLFYGLTSALQTPEREDASWALDLRHVLRSEEKHLLSSAHSNYDHLVTN